MKYGEQAGTVLAGMTLVVILVAAVWGWIANVVSIIGTVSDPITGMFVLRCVGIFVAPLGSVLGFF